MRALGVIAISLLLFEAAGTGIVHAQSSVVTATVRPNPLEVSVSAPGTVVVGKWFEVSADVSNLGSERIGQTVATLNTLSELQVRGNNRKGLGSLGSGQTKIARWQARANTSGNFVVQVEASGNLAGEQISSSNSVNISAIGSLGAFLFRLIFSV